MADLRSCRGYSLVELVVVLLLLGVLVGVSLQFVRTESFSARGYYDELASGLRHARGYAVASGCEVQVVFTGNDFALQRRNVCDGASAFGPGIPHPAKAEMFAGTAPDSVALAGAVDIIFDPMGRATPGGTITVNGGGFSQQIVIHAGSGYVETP